MAYDPQVNVFDPTKVRDNLIGHFQDTQAEALKWANSGTALPVFRDFHLSPRLTTVFPALTVLQFNHKSKWENDILEIEFSIAFEGAIVHGNRDILAARGPKYSMALESMIVNVPETTFNQDSIIDITSTAMNVETAFAVQGKYKSQFIEVFQTRAEWSIEASAFG